MKLASNLPLYKFGFESLESKTHDIEVILGKTLSNKPTLIYSLDKKESFFYSKDIALFTITDGKKIYISPHENAKEIDITQSLINFPIAVRMAQRGNLVLHDHVQQKTIKHFYLLGRVMLENQLLLIH